MLNCRTLLQQHMHRLQHVGSVRRVVVRIDIAVTLFNAPQEACKLDRLDVEVLYQPLLVKQVVAQCRQRVAPAAVRQLKCVPLPLLCSRQVTLYLKHRCNGHDVYGAAITAGVAFQQYTPLLQLTSSMSTAGGSGVSLPVLSQLALEKRRLATVLGVCRLFGSAAVEL